MKLKVISAMLVLFSSSSFAQEEIIQSKEDTPFPPPMEKTIEPNMESKPKDEPQQKTKEKELRKRTHALQWSSTNEETTATSSISTVESKHSEVKTSLFYLYNFERFEIGANINVSTSKNLSTNDKVTNRSIGILGHFNILPNRSGSDFIPYISGAAGNMIIEDEISTISGPYGTIGVGFKWFPFSEIFAFVAEYGLMTAQVRGGAPSITYDITGSGLKISWGIYF